MQNIEDVVVTLNALKDANAKVAKLDRILSDEKFEMSDSRFGWLKLQSENANFTINKYTNILSMYSADLIHSAKARLVASEAVVDVAGTNVSDDGEANVGDLTAAECKALKYKKWELEHEAANLRIENAFREELPVIKNRALRNISKLQLNLKIAECDVAGELAYWVDTLADCERMLHH